MKAVSTAMVYVTGPRERIRPRISDRIGIINPYGQFWTDDTFDTTEQAEKHVSDFYAEMKAEVPKFSYVPVTVTIAAVELPAKQIEPVPFKLPLDFGEKP